MAKAKRPLCGWLLLGHDSWAAVLPAGFSQALASRSSVARARPSAPLPWCWQAVRLAELQAAWWTAFDGTWLAEAIDGNEQVRQASTFRRMRDRIFVTYLRYRLREEWHRIERELEWQGSTGAG